MPDIAPARLHAVRALPTGRGWLYEPKWDGYRGLLARSATGKGSVSSRNAKDLGRWFPELVELAERLPPDTVLDGEIVRPTTNGVSFIALQQRLFARASVGRESPAAFVAFDILRSDGDLRRLTLSHRRRRLEELIGAQADQLLQLVTQTSDRDEATAWLADNLTIAGIEGVVAKLDEPYPRPEARLWRKVRRVSTMDFVVHGFIPEVGESVRLVLATREDGEPRIVGTTYPINGEDVEPLQRLLPLATRAERRIWAPFEDGRHDEWFGIPAGLTAEVAVTTLDSGMLRQPARFVRWRFENPPPRSRRAPRTRLRERRPDANQVRLGGGGGS